MTMESFSGDKYRLLESIFSWDEDIAFLESQPGYDPRIGKDLRAGRRKLAYEWVGELEVEFDELHRQGLVILIHSDVERTDLMRALRRLKFTFYTRVVLLKVQLHWRAPLVDDLRRLRMVFEQLIGYRCIIQDDLIPNAP
jgi:hypothetical protein